MFSKLHTSKLCFGLNKEVHCFIFCNNALSQFISFLCDQGVKHWCPTNQAIEIYKCVGLLQLWLFARWAMYAAAGNAIRQARKGKKSSGSTGPSRQQSHQALLVPTLQADNISVRHLRVGSAVEVPKCVFFLFIDFGGDFWNANFGLTSDVVIIYWNEYTPHKKLFSRERI